jgi:hypothetical protein
VTSYARFRADFAKNPNGTDPWLAANGPIALHLGWFELFYGPKPFAPWFDSWDDYVKRGRPYGQRVTGGRALQIGRGPNRNGTPAGLTHCFRVGDQTRMHHLAWLAHAMRPDWTWMSDRTGQRRYREEWLALYQPHRYAGP